MADVLVAGGGPAGAALAIRAGHAGLTVDLFDTATFPRDKPCGEGLMPAGVGALMRLRVADRVQGRPIDGVRYHGFGITAAARFPAPRRAVEDGGAAAQGMGQRRTVLDATLLAAARATPNVRVFEDATVEGVALRRGRAIGLHVGGQMIPGALIVGADGARSVVRKSLGLDGPPAARARLGVRMHFRLAPEAACPDMVEIFVGKGHEIYLTPLPNHEVLVAALAERGPTDADARGAIDAWIAQHPALAERLRGAEAISAPRGRFPLAQRARAGVAPGAVLLGDAAGFIDPITGGGMAQALLSAELLAGSLRPAVVERDDEWLWRFDRQRRDMLRDYVLLTKIILLAARRPTWARWTLRAMRANPRTMRHLVGVAGGIA